MTIDLSEALDNLHKGEDEKVTPEALQIIVPVLRMAERGVSFKEIASEVNLTPDEVKNLVIRNRGWEATSRERQRQRQSR